MVIHRVAVRTLSGPLIRNYSSLNYILSAIPKKDDSNNNINNINNIKPSSEPSGKSNKSQTTTGSENIKPASGSPKRNPPKDLTKLVLTPNTLNDKFRRQEYGKLALKDISEAQAFFNRCTVNLDWTFDNYDDIPDVKYQILQKQRLETYEKMDPYHRTEYEENLVNSKKTFGIKPELLKALPEILLLGHTNAGKSSLINNLLLSKVENKTAGAKTEYAFVSKRAGYTKTLNCYNIDGKLRIVDSPGYGEFGESKQGKVVIDYISKRHLLRRVFILIDSGAGFRDEDLEIIDHLITSGVPFEVIFTKVDAIVAKYMPKKAVFDSYTKSNDKHEIVKTVEEANQKIIHHYTTMIEEVGLDSLVTLPKLLFNNATTNKFVPMRYGYKEIRCIILQSCGMIDEPHVELVEELTLGRNKSRRKSNVPRLAKESKE